MVRSAVVTTTNQLHLTTVQRLARWALSGPPAVLRRIAGPAVANDEGWQLDLATQVLASLEERFAPPTALDADAAQLRREADRVMPIGMPKRTDVYVTDRTIPGPDGNTIAIRVYQRLNGDSDRPAIVYFHGGGWVVGNLDTHDGTCRYIAASAGCVVVSVDYRLAPEHPFPAAPEDSIAAYAWVLEHAPQLGIDPERVGVMGDSAGGNLAAVVAQQAAPRGLTRPKLQCLVYPATDMSLDSPSHHAFAKGFVLSHESMVYFRNAYSADPDDWVDPMMAPIRATDLSGLSPALVYTAGFDPLRDEGRAYAAALTEAGVSVTERCYHDRVHGFFGMGIFPGALQIIEEICQDVAAAL